MATDIRRLENRLAALRSEVAENSRQLGNLWARIGSPSPGGTLIRWVSLDAPLWRGQEPVKGTLYSDPETSSLSNPGVTPLAEDIDVQASAGHGYYLASASLLHPAVAAGGVWELVGSGVWHLSAVLDEDLDAGGEAQAGLLTVYAPWAPGPEEPIASAGDSIGISWNDETLQWEATVAGCQDESIVAVEA